MWWFKRKSRLKLIPFAEGKPRTFTELLCDGVTAHNLASFADLLALHARLQQDRPDVRVLASLDNLGQAGYTSGHCIETHGLDAIDGRDVSALPRDAFEDGEYLGFLTTRAAFPIRLENLMDAAAGVTIQAAAGVLPWQTPGDSNDLVTVNNDPEQALRIAGEPEVVFQFVPVKAAADALAAFPNGYFSSDLTPIQNLAVARRLEATYGLALFGVGSRFLGFRRGEPFGEAEAQALSDELVGLYEETPPEAAGLLARVVSGRTWLLFRYTES
jgi:hypothetical protein